MLHSPLMRRPAITLSLASCIGRIWLGIGPTFTHFALETWIALPPTNRLKWITLIDCAHARRLEMFPGVTFSAFFEEDYLNHTDIADDCWLKHLIMNTTNCMRCFLINKTPHFWCATFSDYTHFISVASVIVVWCHWAWIKWSRA